MLVQMTTEDLYPIVNGMRIDVEALRRIAHRCVPEKCATRERGCCSTYEVTVGKREIGTIVGSIALAAKYAPELGPDLEAFEDTEGGTCLATDEDGRCVFAYKNSTRTTYCSLHSVALDHDLPPAEVKPRSCALWPLALVEDDPPLLTIQEDAQEFPCNRRRNGSGLNKGVAETIEEVFGAEFRIAVDKAIQ